MEPVSSNPDFFLILSPPQSWTTDFKQDLSPLLLFLWFCLAFFFFPLHLFSQQDANPSALEEIKHHKEKPN